MFNTQSSLPVQVSELPHEAGGPRRAAGAEGLAGSSGAGADEDEEEDEEEPVEVEDAGDDACAAVRRRGGRNARSARTEKCGLLDSAL
jgi:hypothetical protein